MPDTAIIDTPTMAAMRQDPHADEGARAWAMGVGIGESGLTGEMLTRWQWGWRDADNGYRQQFKG